MKHRNELPVDVDSSGHKKFGTAGNKASDSLVRSMLHVCTGLLIAQFAFFTIFGLWFRFFDSYALVFFPVSLLFHIVLYVLLRLFKHDFRKIPSGEVLQRINLANIVTLTRLSTVPTIFFVLHASKDYPVRGAILVLLVPVFLSDLLDGYISRKGNQVTRIGKMLDSASDYSLLFVISFVFYYFHIIPLWFHGLLVFRLAGQCAMVGVVLAVMKQITLKTSFLGKATIASTMMLYAFELLRFMTDIPPVVYDSLEFIVGTIVALSIVDKILIMRRDLMAPAQGSSGPGRLNSIADGEKNGTD